MNRPFLWLSAATLAMTVMSAHAYEAGDWIVRAGPALISPDAGSGTVPGLGPGAELDVDDDWTLGFTIARMLTDNIGLELLGVWPSKHDIEGDGAISALGDVAEARVLPPTLSLQYYFEPTPRVHPYVGVGVNYTYFFDEDTKGALSGANLNLDSSWGLAGEMGIDYALDEDWMANASLWYIDMETEASISGLGDVDVDINPWVFHIGFGRKF